MASGRFTFESDPMNHLTLDELARFAHDLRTSLAAIGGFVQLLEIGVHGPLSPPQARALERIHVNQQQAVMLITEFMHQAEERLQVRGDAAPALAQEDVR